MGAWGWKSGVENSEVENGNTGNEKARTLLCGPRFDLRELRALIADPREAGVIEIINGAQEAHGVDYALPLAGAQAGICASAIEPPSLRWGPPSASTTMAAPAYLQVGSLPTVNLSASTRDLHHLPAHLAAHQKSGADLRGLHQKKVF